MRRKSVKQIINEGNAIIAVLKNENKALKSNVETRKMLLNQTVIEFDSSRKKLREDIKQNNVIIGNHEDEIKELKRIITAMVVIYFIAVGIFIGVSILNQP